MAVTDRGTIRCSACRQDKPVGSFQPSIVVAGCGQCRACKRAAKKDYELRNRKKVNAAHRRRRSGNERHKAVARKWWRTNPEKLRTYNLKRYRLTSSEYDALLTEQGGVCACCGAIENGNGKRFYVDHDHESGQVRGLVCHKCNAGIGALGDTLEGVQRAVDYLKRAKRSHLAAVPAAS